MLNGVTPNVFAMAGTAVLRIVVSSISIKKAIATSQGNNRFPRESHTSIDNMIPISLVGVKL